MRIIKRLIPLLGVVVLAAVLASPLGPSFGQEGDDGDTAPNLGDEIRPASAPIRTDMPLADFGPSSSQVQNELVEPAALLKLGPIEDDDGDGDRQTDDGRDDDDDDVADDGSDDQEATVKIVGHVLKVKGTKDDDKLTLRQNAVNANVLEIDVGDDGSADFSFDRASFTEIKANAKAGNDLIRVDEANGLIDEPASVLGGDGNDTVLGGSGVDTIDGGDGDDFIDGNRGADIAFMGAGDDTFRWDPGDASDVVEGGDGSDTLLFNGSNGGETADLSANGERFTFFRQPGSITMDVNDVETSVFNALGGPDTITVNDLTGTDVTRVNLEPAGGPGDLLADQVSVNGTEGDDTIVVTGSAGSVNVTGLSAMVAITNADAAADSLTVNAAGGDDTVDASALQADAIKQLTVDGASGNDLILGGRGADSLTGGDGDDFIDGNQANDTAFMGAGNDTFRWDPGDGSDVVEGAGGSDTLLFNGAAAGAAANETVELSASGERFIFFREPGSITMDVNDVETSVFNALGGHDAIEVNDLTGTDVTRVELNLENPLGSGAGDGQADQVVVNGTAGNDAIVVTGSAGNVNVTGLSATVAISASEAANDLLTVNALGGDDTVDASGLEADAIKQLTIDGGSGDDLILGGRGADSLSGGDGDDFIDGNQANDIAFMGAGDDTFRWDPGDGSDVVEGEDGSDALLFNGAGADETVSLSANGERFTFFRQPGNITMDVNDVETSMFNALGGADVITVNDLTGTDVTQVNLNLANPLGSALGDGQADQVIVNGTAGDDSIVVTGGAGNVDVNGLSAAVAIVHAEVTNDRLDVNTAAGNDTVDTSGLAAGVIQLFVDDLEDTPSPTPTVAPSDTPSPTPTAAPSDTPSPTPTVVPSTPADTPSPTPTVAPTTAAVVQTATPTAELARPTAAVLAAPASLPNAGGNSASDGSGPWMLLATLLGGIIVAPAAWVLYRRARN